MSTSTGHATASKRVRGFKGQATGLRKSGAGELGGQRKKGLGLMIDRQ